MVSLDTKKCRNKLTKEVLMVVFLSIINSVIQNKAKMDMFIQIHRTHLLRKMLLTSSWQMGGFLELAAILRGLRKKLTSMKSWWTYL